MRRIELWDSPVIGNRISIASWYSYNNNISINNIDILITYVNRKGVKIKICHQLQIHHYFKHYYVLVQFWKVPSARLLMMKITRLNFKNENSVSFKIVNFKEDILIIPIYPMGIAFCIFWAFLVRVVVDFVNFKRIFNSHLCWLNYY